MGTSNAQPEDTSADARARTAALRERIAAGRTVMMVAVEDGEPVAVGSHQPVDIGGSEVSEVVGVATLPRLRGRGLGAGITSALVAHAKETADMVFLRPATTTWPASTSGSGSPAWPRQPSPSGRPRPPAGARRELASGGGQASPYRST